MGFSIGAAVFGLLAGIVGGVVANVVTDNHSRLFGLPRLAVVLIFAVGLAVVAGTFTANSQDGGGRNDDATDTTVTAGPTSAGPTAPTSDGQPTVQGTQVTALGTLLGTPVDGSVVAGTVHPGASVWRLSGTGCDDSLVEQRVTLSDGDHRARFTVALADATPPGTSVDFRVALGSEETVKVLRSGEPVVIDLAARTSVLSLSLRSLTNLGRPCTERPVEVVLFDATLT